MRKKIKLTIQKKTNKKTMHSYTPRSHEEMFKKMSKNIATCEISLKQENEHLKEELANAKKQLIRLNERLEDLENNQDRGVKAGKTSFPQTLSNRPNHVDDDDEDEDDYVKYWQVLGEHFSEVIRRHHEVLGEKERQIRELQDQQYNRDISSGLLNPAKGRNKTGVKIKEITPNDDPRNAVQFKVEIEQEVMAGPSEPYQCEDGCNCAGVPIYGRDSSTDSSGEVLGEHFSEIIRRHKNQLLDKDLHIRELQEALETCQERREPKRHSSGTEVQVWFHDYHDPRKRSGGIQHPASSISYAISLPKARGSSPEHSDHSASDSTATSSDEDEINPKDSTDTFVALEKCQRLESIANLEKLRQNLIKRLELEEKLDKLYWQTELKRYKELCEDAGDSLNPDSSLNTDFEMFENTRLELLKGLKDVKDSAMREPEIYVQPHILEKESDSSYKQPLMPSESEGKRRVTFTEQITITRVIEE